MRFASREPRAVLFVFVPFLLVGAVALLECSSDAKTPAGAGDLPGADAGIVTVNADDGATSPHIVRAEVARAHPVTADLGPAVDANNAFTLDLYRKLAASENGGNFISSPFSANLALTMMYAGAVGETATQMASVLHVPSSGPSIFDGQNALDQAVLGRAATAIADYGEGDDAGTPDIAVQLVNEVWGESTYTWQTPFLDILARDYGTGIYPWDFSNDPAGGESAVNAWVSQATDGEISPLLPPGTIASNTRVVLVNAIHLKLPWDSPFDPSATAPGTFTRGDGSTVQTPFMFQELSYSVDYAETDDAQYVGIPLAANQMSLVFALPKSDLAGLTAALTKDSFTVPPLSSVDSEVDLYAPKFKLSTDAFSLKPALKALGMADAFADGADFTGLCATTPDNFDIFILDVLQRATLDVDEGGIEASAATAVDGDDSSVVESTITVRLDKPFLVAVVDASGAILFLGQVDDPSSGS